MHGNAKHFECARAKLLMQYQYRYNLKALFKKKQRFAMIFVGVTASHDAQFSVIRSGTLRRAHGTPNLQCKPHLYVEAC